MKTIILFCYTEFIQDVEKNRKSNNNFSATGRDIIDI